MTSQHYRTLLFPLSFLPHNEGRSFLLSDASQRAAEQTRAPIFGGQPPPQIPFKFIHLCTSACRPHISEHNKALQSEDVCAPFYTRSDAFMWLLHDDCMRQYDMADFSDVESILVLSQSPIWYSWSRNSPSILYVSVPSLWHGEVLDTKMWL